MDLAARATDLSERYLGGLAQPRSVRWVTNQSERWASCTPASGTIRLSHHLRDMPPDVIDYVLLHELAHLIVPTHDEAFWRLIEGFPGRRQAQDYLAQAAAGLPIEVDRVTEPESALRPGRPPARGATSGRSRRRADRATSRSATSAHRGSRR